MAEKGIFPLDRNFGNCYLMNEYSFNNMIVDPTITEDLHFKRETAGEGKSMRSALRGYGILILLIAAVAWGACG
ncbi:MAG: hypothetical protein GTO00_06875, partial [Deltaproteobacteria bacterium]|nr:hypothetical protein [Deltaproteobacteria bacterium]